MAVEIELHTHVGTFAPVFTPSLIRLVADFIGGDTPQYKSIVERLRFPDEYKDAPPLPIIPSNEFLEHIYAPEIKARISKNIPMGQYDEPLTHYDREYIAEEVKSRFPEDYIKALKDANKAILNLVDGLGLYDNMLELRQEISSTTESVTDNVEMMHSSKYSDIVRYEMTRNHILALPALELIIAKRTDKSQSMVSEFVKWLGTDIFSTSGSKIGETKDVTVYSLHDKQTLENTGEIKIGVGFSNKEYDKNSKIQKAKVYPVRKCVLEGKEYSIYFNERLKDDGNAILKAVKKAIDRKKKGEIRKSISPTAWLESISTKKMRKESDDIRTEDINDRIGAKLVVVEGDAAQFMISLEKQMKRRFGQITDDSQTNIDEDGMELNGKQSKRHTFKRKKLNDHKDFEVIVYTLKECLNAEYDLGNGNNGASHWLYGAQRLLEIARELFPHKIYPRLNLDVAYKKKLCELSEFLLKLDTI